MKIEDIKYKHFNERDVEVPLLLDFAKRHTFTGCSLLDVGAHYSSATYLKDLLEYTPLIDGVDIIPPYSEEEKSMFRKYITGNVNTVQDKYDFVTCISTIEHSGISTYKTTDPVAEQYKTFESLCRLARKAVFLTFPYGKEGGYLNEFRNITSENVFNFVCGIATKKFPKCHLRYFFNEFPQGQKKWIEVDAREASKVEYVIEKGCRCFCSMEVYGD